MAFPYDYDCDCNINNERGLKGRQSENLFGGELHNVFETVRHVSDYFADASVPVPKHKGAIWVDRRTNEAYVYMGTGFKHERIRQGWLPLFADKFKIFDEMLNEVPSTSPVIGQLWLYNDVLMYYDGSNWKPVKALEQSDSQFNISAFSDFAIYSPLNRMGSMVISDFELEDYLKAKKDYTDMDKALLKSRYKFGDSIVTDVRQQMSFDLEDISYQYLVPNIEVDRVFLDHRLDRNYQEQSRSVVQYSRNYILNEQDAYDDSTPVTSHVKYPSLIHINPGKMSGMHKRLFKINIRNPKIMCPAHNTEFYGYKVGDMRGHLLIPAKTLTDTSGSGDIKYALVDDNGEQVFVDVSDAATPVYVDVVSGSQQLSNTYTLADYQVQSDGIYLSSDAAQHYDYVLAITYEFSWMNATGQLRQADNRAGVTSFYVPQKLGDMNVFINGFDYEDHLYSWDEQNRTLTLSHDVSGNNFDTTVWGVFAHEYGFITDMNLSSDNYEARISTIHKFNAPLIFLNGEVLCRSQWDYLDERTLEPTDLSGNKFVIHGARKDMCWTIIDMVKHEQYYEDVQVEVDDTTGEIAAQKELRTNTYDIGIEDDGFIDNTSDYVDSYGNPAIPLPDGLEIVISDVKEALAKSYEFIGEYVTNDENETVYIQDKNGELVPIYIGGNYDVVPGNRISQYVFVGTPLRDDDGNTVCVMDHNIEKEVYVGGKFVRKDYFTHYKLPHVVLFVNGLMVRRDDLRYDYQRRMITCDGLEPGMTYVLLNDPDDQLYTDTMDGGIMPALSVGKIDASLVYHNGYLLNESSSYLQGGDEEYASHTAMHGEIKAFDNGTSWKIFNALKTDPIYNVQGIWEPIDDQTGEDIKTFSNSYVNTSTAISLNPTVSNLESDDIVVFGYKLANYLEHPLVPVTCWLHQNNLGAEFVAATNYTEYKDLLDTEDTVYLTKIDITNSELVQSYSKDKQLYFEFLLSAFNSWKTATGYDNSDLSSGELIKRYKEWGQRSEDDVMAALGGYFYQGVFMTNKTDEENYIKLKNLCAGVRWNNLCYVGADYNPETDYIMVWLDGVRLYPDRDYVVVSAGTDNYGTFKGYNIVLGHMEGTRLVSHVDSDGCINGKPIEGILTYIIERADKGTGSVCRYCVLDDENYISGTTNMYSTRSLRKEYIDQDAMVRETTADFSLFPGNVRVYADGVLLSSEQYQILDNHRILFFTDDQFIGNNENYPEQIVIDQNGNTVTIKNKQPEKILIEVRDNSSWNERIVTVPKEFSGDIEVAGADSTLPLSILDTQDTILMFIDGLYHGLTLNNGYTINKTLSLITIRDSTVLEALRKNDIETYLRIRPELEAVYAKEIAAYRLREAKKSNRIILEWR